MDSPIAEWLVSDFVVFGIQFQHWMALVAAIILLAIVWAWLRDRRTP